MPSEAAITHDFDRLLAQYPGFFKELVAFVDDIRQYGSLKQAINDAGLRMDKLRAGADAQEAANAARLVELDAQFAAKKATNEAAHKANLEEIANMMIAAKLDAENIKASGQRAKDAILGEARAVAATAEKRAQEARLLAETHEAKAVDKQTQIADLDAAIAARQADLDRITQSIADLKAKLG